MNQADLARTVDAISGWTPPEGVSSKLYVSADTPDIKVKVILAAADYSVALKFQRPPTEVALKRLTVLAEELLEWAADEVVSIAGHQWN